MIAEISPAVKHKCHIFVRLCFVFFHKSLGIFRRFGRKVRPARDYGVRRSVAGSFSTDLGGKPGPRPERSYGSSEATAQTELRHPTKRGRSPSGIILRALSARPKLLLFIAILVIYGGDLLPADLRYPLSAISLATKIPLAEA